MHIFPSPISAQVSIIYSCLHGILIGLGKWRSSNFGLGHDPQKKTLGILGMGGIGQVRTEFRLFPLKRQGLTDTTGSR